MYVYIYALQLLIHSRCCLEIEHIVASYQNISQKAGKLAVNDFFGPFEVQIHVTVTAVESPLVFHVSPFEFDQHLLPDEIREKWFGIYDKLGLSYHAFV